MVLEVDFAQAVRVTGDYHRAGGDLTKLMGKVLPERLPALAQVKPRAPHISILDAVASSEGPVIACSVKPMRFEASL